MGWVRREFTCMPTTVMGRTRTPSWSNTCFGWCNTKRSPYHSRFLDTPSLVLTGVLASWRRNTRGRRWVVSLIWTLLWTSRLQWTWLSQLGGKMEVPLSSRLAGVLHLLYQGEGSSTIFASHLFLVLGMWRRELNQQRSRDQCWKLRTGYPRQMSYHQSSLSLQVSLQEFCPDKLKDITCPVPGEPDSSPSHSQFPTPSPSPAPLLTTSTPTTLMTHHPSDPDYAESVANQGTTLEPAPQNNIATCYHACTHWHPFITELYLCSCKFLCGWPLH